MNTGYGFSPRLTEKTLSEGQSGALIPRPGLVNCLSTPCKPHSPTISLLCHDAVRCILSSSSLSPSTSTPSLQHAILHAFCTSSTLYTVNLAQGTSHYKLMLHDLSSGAISVISPHLHFQPRSLSACVCDNGSHRVVVGGYDGAYVSEGGRPLRVLPGCQGFPVCAVSSRPHGIAVALVDARVAVWNNTFSTPQTLVQRPASASSGPGDRVTDIGFTPDKLAVAYWSGLVTIYDRKLRPEKDVTTTKDFATKDVDDNDSALGWKIKELMSIWTTKGQAVPETEFFKRGPTMIVEKSGSGVISENECVIAAVDGAGCIVFIDLSNNVSVRREIVRTSSCSVTVKGACADNYGDEGRLVVWVTDSNELVCVDWPSSKEMSVAKRVAKEVDRRIKAKAIGTNQG